MTAAKPGKTALEQLQEAAKKYHQEAARPCPSCGYCPTCGRAATPYIRYVPYVQPHWWDSNTAANTTDSTFTTDCTGGPHAH